jgi:hypothetical protein
MHGVSGDAAGEYPVSTAKVVATTLLFLGIFVAIAAAMWFFLFHGHL